MSGYVGLKSKKTIENNSNSNIRDDGVDNLLLNESEVIYLILEYLNSRKLTGSQLELEKETGIFNEILNSPDIIFLRGLILEGRWDDVLEFLQPLEEAFKSFPGNKVKENIYKYYFLDKITTAQYSLTTNTEDIKSKILEELVKILNEYELYCESKEEYSSLCLLLTSPSRLSQHPEYKDWKPGTARLVGFESIKSLVIKYIPPPHGPPKQKSISKNDRLIQLLIKGLLYETSLDYCTSKASTSKSKQIHYFSLLNESQLSEGDLSLISWLQSLPSNVFGNQFQKRNLRIDIEPLQPIPPRILMNVSIIDTASDLLSRSMASTSFHLSCIELQQSESSNINIKNMTTSVDRLFGDMAIDSFHQSITHNSTNKSTQQHQQLQPSQKSTIPQHEGGGVLLSLPQSQRDGGKFIPVTLLEDVQAVRCAEFHPLGNVFAIGSNSKTLRLCGYPDLSKLKSNHVPYQPTILYKKTKHHKGSIYCMGWSPDGNYLATGSNDKSVKLLIFNDINNPELGSTETELTMHDGTIRDICFIQDISNKSSLLVSGGAGDCKIYITDLSTSTPFQALSGHTGPILCLYNWGGGLFCSGSQDKSIRFWDLRTRGCVDVINPLTSSNSTKSPVASICVEPSGRLLISGHEDGGCVLYDIRGQRQIQSIKIHSSDVRSVRFSPASYYLLSAGYDNNIVLSDLQGDLSLPLPSVQVGSHQDKVISGRWHPTEFTFLSTSADKTSILWALPPEI